MPHRGVEALCKHPPHTLRKHPIITAISGGGVAFHKRGVPGPLTTAGRRDGGVLARGGPHGLGGDAMGHGGVAEELPAPTVLTTLTKATTLPTLTTPGGGVFLTTLPTLTEELPVLPTQRRATIRRASSGH